MKEYHEPVLLKEAIEFLHIKKGGKYIDATYGAGGHANAILEHGGSVLALEWDPVTIKHFKFPPKVRLAKGGKIENLPGLKLINGNFKNIEEITKNNGFYPADGALFDLGISSIQLDDSERGFSFQTDALLDMRVNKDELGVIAADLVNGLREDQLFELFSQTSDLHVSRLVARAIVRTRGVAPIRRTNELADLVNSVYRGRERRINPATTIFLALRMAVNTEIENLEAGLAGAFNVLASSGRLAVISFHSGEDRVVKNFLRDKEKGGGLKVLTKDPIVPDEREVTKNPRARSAKLRVGEKL